MYKKIRFFFWILEAHTRRHFFKALVALLFLGIIGGGIFFITPFVAAQHSEDVFIEGVVGTYTLKKLPPEVLGYISKGLIEIDPSGKPKPLIAESVSVSEEGKVFTIKLKKDILWHNGNLLTSNDLAYNLQEVIVERPDDNTLIFKLKDPFAPFPTLLTSPLFKISRNDEVLGVGDYRIVKAGYNKTQHLTQLELVSNVKSPKKLVIKFYQTEQEAITGLKLGEIHGLRVSTPFGVRQWQNLTIYKKIVPRQFIGIFVQMKDNIVGGKDPSLRHALSASLASIPEEQPFIGPYSQSSWAHVPFENKYQFNQDKAKEFLAAYRKKAGMTPDQNIGVKLTTFSKYTQIAEQVKKSWEEVGINTEIELVNSNPGEFQLLLTEQDLPADPDQYNLWHSTQTNTNITNYNNLRVDKDLEDGRKTIDEAKRMEKYLDFQKIIREELPILYMHHSSNYYAVMKKYDRKEVRELKGF